MGGIGRIGTGRIIKMITTNGENLNIQFQMPFDAAAYDLFKKCKKLPESKVNYDYALDTYTIETHSRYANLLGVSADHKTAKNLPLSGFLFEHQKEIVKLALAAKTFAVWADCGLGKTNIELEFAHQVNSITNGRSLILTLPEVALQTIDECKTFYGKNLPILFLETKDDMRRWCAKGDNVYKVAITNYEKMNPEKDNQIVAELKFLSGIIVDENRLKGGGGKQKWAIIKSSKGIPFKMTATATPAPNDYIEFASQASFLERMRSENEIIWTFFAKDKITGEWTVKRHAQQAFFEWMCAWSIYVRNPKNYGWSFDVELPPDPEIIRHEIQITQEQSDASKVFNIDQKGQASLFATQAQGIVGRSKLSQIAKGFVYEKDKSVTKISSHKPKFVAELIQSEANQSQVLVWTVFDAETEIISGELKKSGFANFAVLTGKTSNEKRLEILNDYRNGKLPVLISNSKLLGYGMNLQMTGSMIFSGWNDSFEEWYQTIRRAVRFGNKKKVKIHIPFIPELELAQLENIFRKETKFITGIEAQEAAYVKAMQRIKLL
jgi:superfamily II DNA or RNA helicase